MEEADDLAKYNPLHDKVWRLAAAGRSCDQIARALGKGPAWVKKVIIEYTKELREISNPDQKALNRAIVVHRLDWASGLLEEKLEACEQENGDHGTFPALMAVYVKTASERGKFTCVSTDEMDGDSVLQVNRIEETARRLALIGPHSRAREMAPAIRAALSLAGVKPAVAREVMPKSPQES